ncbi:MAG: calcium-binding protein [Alphaproteobacteria bacterium]|nr:calcium-binding protein [Alphaproteobacteria bacterium]
MTTHTMDPMVFDNMEDLTDAAESWSGNYGNDSVKGMGGDDTLTGDAGAGQDTDGASHDFINGNMGDDSINGGQGNDTLRGGADDDMVDGGAGNDMVYGDKGNDTLMGGAGDDMMHGGDGHDSLEGGGGGDTMRGGMGHDRLEGGAGNDMIYGDKGNDDILGGAGNDMLYGGEGTDSIMAGDGADFANGNQGMDTINGGAGNDTLRGGRDNDMIDGGDGDDMIYGDKGVDTLDGMGGADTIYGDNMMPSPDHTGDMIIGGMEENWGEITDKLGLVEQASGNKIVYGDELYGGAGDDTIQAGDSADGDGTMNAEVTFSYPSGGQTAKFMFVHGNMLDGGAGDDMLTGAGGQDTLDGGAGKDELVGGAGKDMLMGGTGDDMLSDGGAIGGNKLEGNSGNDKISAAYRSQEVVTNTDDNTMNDSISGGAADTLMGGAGNDTLMVSEVIGDTAGLNDTPADGTASILTVGKAGLVMDGGSGADVFDFTNVGDPDGTPAGIGFGGDSRTFIEIKGFSVGVDRVHLDLGTADGTSGLTEAFENMKTLLRTEAANADEGTPELTVLADAAGNMAQVGGDTFVSLGNNVVLKFIGIGASAFDNAEGEANQVFFEV